MQVRDLARLRPPRARTRTYRLSRFRYGLNTALPASQVLPTELTELVNYKVVPGGRLEVRPGISRYSTAAPSGSAAIASIGRAVIGTTAYILVADENHKLYYLDSSRAPVSIGTLEGTPEIVSFNGAALLMDGGYLKYLDNLSAIKLAYDDGSGPGGCQFDTTADTDDATIALGNGTNNRVAYRFTSQAWSSGYTIPPTTAKVKLSAAGSPNASAVTAKLRKVSDDSVLATAELVKDASTLTATAEIFSADFAVTTQMSPSTDYYLSIEHGGGDASNYVKVHCRAVSSGGHAYVYTTSWSADATRDPLACVKPGRPPKARFGTVHDLRVWMVSPDAPGRVLFCNYTHLDWSTPGYAGWLGVIDDDAAGFPVGAIRSLYGDLFVYGTAESPYICRLVGNSAADFAFGMLFQRIWSTQQTLKSVIVDLWGASSDGVDALTGVQEYGDLRTRRASDAVIDRIQAHFDADSARAGYYGADGQYWLVMPGYHRILVARVVPPERDPFVPLVRHPWMEYELYRDDFSADGYQWNKSSGGSNEYYLTADVSRLKLASGGLLKTQAGGGLELAGSNSSDPGITTAPDFVTVDDRVASRGTVGSLKTGQWGFGDNDSLGFDTVYYRGPDGSPDETGVVLRSVMVPTCLEDTGDHFLLGGSDGFVYEADADAYQDLGKVNVNPRWRTAYIQMPFGEVNMDGLQLLASSRHGISLTMQLFTNDREYDPAHQWPMTMPVSDDLTLAEATMTLLDAEFPLASENTVPWAQLNINLRSFMLRGCEMMVIGRPTSIEGVLVRYRQLRP